jgi:hypothetical protein
MILGQPMAGSRENAKENDVLVLAPLYVTILSALLVFSCGAAKSPQEITVRVPDEFSGIVRVTPCDRTSAERAIASSQGVAATTACPGKNDQVTLVLIRSGQIYRIPPEQVTIRRAGDGLPVSIEAVMPSR